MCSIQAAKENPAEFETKLVGTVTIPEVVRLDQEVIPESPLLFQPLAPTVKLLPNPSLLLKSSYQNVLPIKSSIFATHNRKQMDLFE